MHTGTPLTLSISRSALARLHSARRDEPDPLHASPAEVARYVARLQQAGRALSHAHEAATHSNLPASEADLLVRRRTSVDVAIARQANLAARRIGTDRPAALATLNALFDLGSTPDPPLDAIYAGELLTSTLFPPLDSFGRALARLWLLWKGKRFDAATSTGHNYLTPGGHTVARLVWPLYNRWSRANHSLYRCFYFKTSTGPSVDNPNLTTLKLDYNLPENPALLVRSVLDELVQLSGGYYLGKSYLRTTGGKPPLAAFFALHDERII